MANKAVPVMEIDRELSRLAITPTVGGYYSYDHTRVYERIDGKFVAYGYRIVSRNFIFTKEQDDFDIVLPDTILV